MKRLSILLPLLALAAAPAHAEAPATNAPPAGPMPMREAASRAKQLLQADDWDGYKRLEATFPAEAWREVRREVLPLHTALWMCTPASQTDAFLSLYEECFRDIDEGSFDPSFDHSRLEDWMFCYRVGCFDRGVTNRFAATIDRLLAEPSTSSAGAVVCLQEKLDWELFTDGDGRRDEEDRAFSRYVAEACKPGARAGLEFDFADPYWICRCRYQALQGQGRTNELDGVVAAVAALAASEPAEVSWTKPLGIAVAVDSLLRLGRTNEARRAEAGFAARWADALSRPWNVDTVLVPAALAQLPPDTRDEALRTLLRAPGAAGVAFDEDAPAAGAALRDAARRIVLADPAGVSESAWSLADGSEPDDAFFETLVAARGDPFARWEAAVAGPTRGSKETPETDHFPEAFGGALLRHALQSLASDRGDRFEALVARLGPAGRMRLAAGLANQYFPDDRPAPRTDAWADFFAARWKEQRSTHAFAHDDGRWFAQAARLCPPGRLLALLDAIAADPETSEAWTLETLLLRSETLAREGRDDEAEAAARDFADRCAAALREGRKPHALRYRFAVADFLKWRRDSLSSAGREADAARAAADLETLAPMFK